MNTSAINMKDGYKVSHKNQYPVGTEVVYSNFTPRSSRIKGSDEIVVFGIQYFIKKYIIESFDQTFFSQPKEKVVASYKRLMDGYLGVDTVTMDHIEALHDLQYMPLRIKTLPEGTVSSLKVPFMTIVNTRPEFFWLTNLLETIISTTIWMPITSATTSYRYRKLMDRFAVETGSDPETVQFQCHDFSMRGMAGLEAAEMSAASHLLSFVGTDTVCAVPWLEEYYAAEGFIGCSVPATEHSVMSAGGNGEGEEIATFKRLINELYPSGIVSIVSDTWDFWKVVTEYLPALKGDIMARDGKTVIRPDSSDPVDIICGDDTYPEYSTVEEAIYSLEDEVRDLAFEDCEGAGNCGSEYYDATFKVDDKYYEVRYNVEYNRYDKQYYYIEEMDNDSPVEITLSPQNKGLIECLWRTFGGTINEAGYKVLDSHIGAIYGDSITYERAEEILERLKSKGFASSNIVFGIGSFTYQYVTRDTYGMAMKATYVEVNGEGRDIFKDPVTNVGAFSKKSAKGLIQVTMDEAGNTTYKDQCTWEEEAGGLLETVFEDGVLIKEYTLQEIRERLNN